MSIKLDKVQGIIRDDDYPASEQWQLVGQRCGQNGQLAVVSSTRTNVRLNNYSRHYIPTGASAIKLIYSGMYLQSAKPAEKAIEPNVFSADEILTLSSGTGYIIGEILTFANAFTNAPPLKIMITAINAGVPIGAEIVDGGIYLTPVNTALTQTGTTGRGTGASFTVKFKGYAAIGHISIVPNVDLAQSLTGVNALISAKKGMKLNGEIERRILLPMSGIVETDSIPIDIPVSGRIGIKATWITGVCPTGRAPDNIVHGASINNEGAFKGTTWNDETTGTYTSIGEATSAYLFQPAAIMGIPKKKLPAIFGFGDSRTVGTGAGQGTYVYFDSVDDYGNVGCFERALSQDYGCFYPWTNFSKGGIALDHYFGTTTPLTFGHQDIINIIRMIKPTAVYLYLCTNDINTGQPYNTVRLREQQLIAEIKGCGVKYVFTSTMEPYTTSTDQWATLENQTPVNASYEAIRNQRNTALVEGTYADYDFVVDNRLRTEPSINANKWIVNGEANYATGDGIHASNPMHIIQAEGISEAIKSHIPIS